VASVGGEEEEVEWLFIPVRRRWPKAIRAATVPVEGGGGGGGCGCSGLEEEDNKHRFLECYTFVSDKRKA
jgi:hypothetical protein